MTAEGDKPDDEVTRGDLAPQVPAPADTSPLHTEPPVPPARVEPVVVPRWIQIVALTLGLLAAFTLARAAAHVVLLFLVAAVIAMILNPLVKLVQRTRAPRGIAVAAVYIGFFALLAGVVALLATPVSDQVAAFQRDVPGLTKSANKSLAGVQDWLDGRGIGIQVKKQGETALETLSNQVAKGSGDLVAFTRDLVQTMAKAAFAMVLIFVLSVYMLLNGNRIGAGIRAAMPPGDGTPEDDFPIRAQKAVSSYVRGQLAFSVTMGLSAGVALWIFGTLGIFPDGRSYALFFGAFFGLMELVPFVGPILGAIPPILVALIQDPVMAVWVGLLFLALQQMEGHVVAPLLFGQVLRINPLLVLFALLLGAELYGIVGALISLPLAAMARETVVYLRRHLVLEPWATLSPAAVAAGGAMGPVLEPDHPCPNCGSARASNQDGCPQCGALEGAG